MKESKSVAVFIANQGGWYDKYEADAGGAKAHGGADLSDIEVGEGCTVAIVEDAKYLGLG